VITGAVLTESLGRLSLLKRSPTSPHALKGLGRILEEICRDDSEARTLVDYTLRRHNEWPGPEEIRHIYRDEIAPRQVPEAESAGCPKCQFKGIRIGYRITTMGGERLSPVIYTEGPSFREDDRVCERLRNEYAAELRNGGHIGGAAYPCECPKGQQVREQWRRYDESKAH
jgi:hypothetical protein